MGCLLWEGSLSYLVFSETEKPLDVDVEIVPQKPQPTRLTSSPALSEKAELDIWPESEVLPNGPAGIKWQVVTSQALVGEDQALFRGIP